MNADTYKTLILPLSSKLLGFAERILNNRDDAKDAVQEVFIKLWQMRNELDKYNSLEALAMKMTKNKCLDKIKLKKTIPLENNRVEPYQQEELFNYYDDNIEKAIQKVKIGIDKLPEQQKLVMQLRDLEGYDNEEISFIMNMNINSVRVALSRARQKVKNYLIKNLQYGSQGNQTSFREIL